MTTRGQNWDWRLTIASCLGIGGVIASSFDCALAQITPDGTLPNNSIITPQGNTSLIEGGTTTGSNLFHSFDEFSIPTGSEASFNNAVDIQNIISRVTGGSISNINGLLRANGGTNLFLLNPNGIIFGPNAGLNIGGSFLGTTASRINFADGTQFASNASQTTPLLTLSVPLGLQFGSNPGKILVQGNGQGIRLTPELIDTSVGLRVQPNATLALIGGDVALEGATLKTAGGRIELGSVAGPSQVSLLTSIDKGWALSYEGVQNFQNIQLSQQAAVDASGPGGSLQVQGKQIILSSGSQIEASTLGFEPAGTLNVTASESIELIGISVNSQFPTGLFTTVYSEATGTGGNLTLETERLSIRDGAQIQVATFGSGSAGSLTVNAEAVELIGASADIQFGSGLAISTESTGTGGNLTIETERLSVRDGAQIQVATFGSGSAGSLTVNAEAVELTGTTADGRYSSGLLTSTESTGAGGDLTIETEMLSVRDGAGIGASTFGSGSAGSLTVNAEAVEVSGTSADGQLPSILSARSEGAGNAGSLRIKTGQLSVRDRAQIAVSSEGSGSAGQLEITARSMLLDKQATLTATTRSGNGGNIKLQAQDLILMRRGSEISTTAGLAGTGGDGGNIDIDTNFLAAVSSENSDITANAYEGNGGRVTITASGIFGQQYRDRLTTESDITASSEFGVDGVVELNTPDVDPSRGLVTLPAELFDLTQLITQGCPTDVGPSASKFVVTGRGGLPPTPREALSGGDTILEDWGDLALTYAAEPQNKLSYQRKRLENRTSDPAVSVNSASSKPASIVEATGWIVDADSNVTLVATAPTAMPHSLWQTPADCHGS